MDLIEVDPVLNLYDRDWPIRTLPAAAAAAEVRLQRRGPAGHARRGEAHRQHGLPGLHRLRRPRARAASCRRNVRVNSYALVEDSILFDGVDVGRHCRIRRAIIDKDVKIPPNTTIGYDTEHDRQRGFTITEPGVVVIAKAELPETFQAPNPLPN